MGRPPEEDREAPLDALGEVVAFLLGEGSLMKPGAYADGGSAETWFGDDVKPRYWWRSILRERWLRAASPSSKGRGAQNGAFEGVDAGNSNAPADLDVVHKASQPSQPIAEKIEHAALETMRRRISEALLDGPLSKERGAALLLVDRLYDAAVLATPEAQQEGVTGGVPSDGADSEDTPHG